MSGGDGTRHGGGGGVLDDSKRETCRRGVVGGEPTKLAAMIFVQLAVRFVLMNLCTTHLGTTYYAPAP